MKENIKSMKEEACLKRTVDNDGDFAYETVEWAGPMGYVIVIPKGNPEAQKSAELLQDYYRKTLDVTLDIVSDEEAESAKEILIGKTNRSQSRKDMDEKELRVSVNGLKLVFDGGHDVTVNSAVGKFIRLSPGKGKACTFFITTDFVSTVLDGYRYVWGDEFEGTSLDMDKFCYEATMRGTEHLEISKEKDVIRVEDGRLKLTALLKSNPAGEDTYPYYKTGYAVSTTNTMNFTYGYVEIRARVPFCQGTWPSFWAQSGDWISGKRNKDYMLEVDVFENMGSKGQLETTMHKWYTNKTHGSHEVKKWDFENTEALSTEYHTYGWEWTPEEMSMYVDGVKYTTFDITKSFDDNEDMSGCHDAMRINFNNYIMNVDLNWHRNLPNPEELPFEYYIDYIRLYQKEGQGALYTSK